MPLQRGLNTALLLMALCMVLSHSAQGQGNQVLEIPQKGKPNPPVWQAERVKEGDVWKTYYGVVGRHVVARVPAEEIELPPRKP